MRNPITKSVIANAKYRYGKYRSRKSARGAALVEAVVVIPFFIIMFVGTLYIGKTYQTKLNVIGLSKEGAWTSAMDSCGSPGNATPNGNTSPSPNAPTPSVGDQGSPNPQGADFSNANKYGAGAPNGNIAQTGTSQASTSMQQSVTPDMILGGVSKTMKIQESVTCNEPAYDGDLKGFLNAAVAAF